MSCRIKNYMGLRFMVWELVMQGYIRIFFLGNFGGYSESKLRMRYFQYWPYQGTMKGLGFRA